MTLVKRGYSYAANFPHQTPDSLNDLHGPTAGSVTVGHHINTALDPTYSLDSPARARSFYSATVRDGTPADHARYLNKELLIAMWPDLNLPTRCRVIWETKFPELTHHGKDAHA
ncbi:hypothetical protein GSY69_10920 [Brevibacterium sp. 5221]|uniref:Uncharacterized protein n=1 Tax=Brevibacterium rongguiense TaxID=2695267 RepID=A0A6N9H9F3_9MICO|nr:hypothetical protein [Brevibacterium rongguiense]MYM20461.1 hypothetical protein [Brevibacterium rongguiense]